MDIRPATTQDIPELFKLVHSCYREGWSSEARLLDLSRTTAAVLESQIKRKDSVIFKYRDLTEFPNGRILGCAHVEKVEKNGKAKCYFGLMSVSPEQQSKGIGKKLLAVCEGWAKERKCASIYMAVISSRDSVIAWYEREGFQSIGEKQSLLVPTDPAFGAVKTKEIVSDCFEKFL